MFEQIAEKVNILKNGNKAFLSNACFSPMQLKEIIGAPNTAVKISENGVVILEEEESFVRVYFYFAAEEFLGEILRHASSFTGKPLIAEVIGNEKATGRVVSALENTGFAEHNRLMRMLRKVDCVTAASSLPVIYAGAKDLDNIMQLLYEEFDIYTSHLPQSGSVLESINREEIIVTRKDGSSLAGLAYFESKGINRKYLYQIVVEKNMRGRGLGETMLSQGLSLFPPNTVCELWVEDRNSAAIKLYEKYDFRKDGMLDYVMIYLNGGKNNGKNI